MSDMPLRDWTELLEGQPPEPPPPPPSPKPEPVEQPKPTRLVEVERRPLKHGLSAVLYRRERAA